MPIKNNGYLLIILFIFLFFLRTVGTAQGSPALIVQSLMYQFYVDPVNGNDTYTGTITQPFQTLLTALSQVKLIKRNNSGLLDKDVHIILRGGTYYLNSTLVLGPGYSGNNGKTVYVEAYTGETPIISGGMKLGTVTTSGQWTTTIPSGVFTNGYFKKLRVGNTPAIRARYPAYNPNNPFNGDILFNDWCGKPWEKGLFNFILGTGGVGGEFDWNNIQTQQSGTYTVWVRYSYVDGGAGIDNEENQSLQLTVDNSPTTYPLSGLSPTSGWGNFAWVKGGTVNFSASGSHTLKLRDVQPVTLNLDALLLSSDASFDPRDSQDFTINSDNSYTIPTSYTGGGDVLVIQAEAANSIISPAFYPLNTNAGNIPVYGFLNTMCLPSSTFPDLSASSWSHAQIYYFPSGIGATNISTVTATGTTPNGDSSMTLSTPASYGMEKESAGDRFYIENIKEALTQNGQLVPNEWYLDQSTGTLYYNNCAYNAADCSAPASVGDVIAPTINTLIQLEGVSGNPISNIIFDGLTFMDTDYIDYNNQTVPASQFKPPVSYALEMDYANNITIRNSVFENLGDYAIGLENSSYHNFIYANTLNNLGGGGIGIGYNSLETTSSNANVISFNTISNVGRTYRNSTAGVAIMSGSDNLVSNNNIHDTSFASVFINGQPGFHSFANAIEYNDMIDSDQEGNDMGPMYMNTGTKHADTGTLIKYNFIKNTNGVCSTSGGTVITPCFTEAVYLDSDSSGIEIYGNVIKNAANVAVVGNSVKDVSVDNNIFYNDAITRGPNAEISFLNWDLTLQNVSVHHNIFTKAAALPDAVYNLESIGNVTAASFEIAFPNKATAYQDALFTCLQNNNYFDTYGHLKVDLTSQTNQENLQNVLQNQCGDSTEYPILLTLLQQAQSYNTNYGPIDDNIYNNIEADSTSSWMSILGPGWSPWTNAGFDLHSIVNQDPLLADPDNDDFTVQSGSPAFSLGFQAIPFNLIGNTGYPAANHAPVLSPISTQTVSLGSQVQFTVTASSLDNDIQSLTAMNPPKGAIFSVNGGNTSGTFTWTPSETGSYQVGFLVQDAKGLADVTTVMINVTGDTQYYWPFDEGGGIVSHEKNFNLNDALLYLNFACTPEANCSGGPSGWTTGLSGHALLFNKNYGDRIQITSDNYTLSPYYNSAFSIVFYFKPNSLDNTVNTYNFLMVDDTYLGDGFRMAIVQGALKFWSTQDTGSLSLASANNAIVAGQWYQVVISYNGTSGAMYLNGQQMDSESGIVVPTLNDLSIGNTGGVPFDGVFDELSIYNRALSQAEVSILFDNSPLNSSQVKQPAKPVRPLSVLSPLTPASSQAAIVSPNAFSLNVSTVGNGMVFGAPGSAPNNFIINCGINIEATICNTKVNPNTTVTLTAPTDNDYAFTGWAITGSPANNTCTGTTSPCSFTLTAATSVTANFTPND